MRKTIKKLLAGVLVAVCMTALFAGCVIETPEQAARNAAGSSYSTASSSENSANTSDSSQSESSESSASSTSSEKADKTTSESKADTEKQESASSSSEKNNGSSSEKESASSASSKGSQSSSKPKATAKPSGGSGSGGGNSQSSQPEEDTLTCTLSVTCKTVLDNLEFLDPTRKDCIGDNGVIYAKKTVSFEEGETVFDVLSREMQKNGIHMDSPFTPVYNSRYIKAINNLYEFDCGEGSGWMYRVNGVFPNYGCSQYQVEDGDTIEWLYTCDLGVDLGRNY